MTSKKQKTLQDRWRASAASIKAEIELYESEFSDLKVENMSAHAMHAGIISHLSVIRTALMQTTMLLNQIEQLEKS